MRARGNFNGVRELSQERRLEESVLSPEKAEQILSESDSQFPITIKVKYHVWAHFRDVFVQFRYCRNFVNSFFKEIAFCVAFL